MKHLKLYEKYSERPQVGDYVIAEFPEIFIKEDSVNKD